MRSSRRKCQQQNKAGKFKYLTVAILSVLSAQVWAAQMPSANTKITTPVTRVVPAKDSVVFKSGPPVGFKNIAAEEKETNLVSVYFNGQLIANVPATFTDDTIQFAHPQNIIKRIPNVTQPQLVQGALSKALPEHQSYLCSDQAIAQHPFCTVLRPEVAGVIFNPSTFRADLFINPKYLKASGYNIGPLPNSTAPFSVMSSNGLSVNHSNGSSAYAWQNVTRFASGDNQATVDLNYTQTDTKNIPTTRYLNFNQLTAGRYHNGVLFQAGMFTPIGNAILTGVPVAGLSVQNYGVVTQTQSIQGSPLIIYLPLAASIEVSENGSVIYVTQLKAGSHALNTSTFPVGAYNVQIKITNRLGQTRTVTRFFTKEPGLPAANSSHFQVSMGLWQRQNQITTSNDQVLWPTFFDIPVFQLNDVRRFTANSTFQTTVITDFSQVFSSFLINYYFNRFTLTPGVMVSNDRTQALVLNSVYTRNAWAFSLYGTKVFTKKSAAFFENTLNDSKETFYPLNTNELSATGSVSYNWAKNSIVYSNTVSRIKGQGTQVSYSANFNHTLFSNGDGTMQFTAGLTRADQDTQGSIGLNVVFTTPTLTTNLGLSMDNSTDQTTSNAVVNRHYQGTGTLGVNKYINYGPLDYVNLSAQAEASVSQQTYSGGLSWDTPAMQLQLNASNSQIEQDGFNNSNTNLTGQFNSTVVYGDGDFGFGNAQGQEAAVLIDVKSPQTVPVHVLVDGGPIATVQTNDPTPVFMQGYATHKVSIQPVSKTIYAFDHTPKIITLYQGNIQTLNWTLAKQAIVFMQIVNAKHQPMADLLLKHKGQFDTTGASGYIQANIKDNTQQLTFRTMSGAQCHVTLPALKPVKGVVVLKTPLVCAVKA